MLIGGMVGGRAGAEIAFVFALAMNFFSYWFSDKMVLRAYGAQPLDAAAAPELYSIVQELAHAGAYPDAAAVPDRQRHAQRVRDRPQSQSCGGGRDARNTCGSAHATSSRAYSAHELSHVINRDILTSSIAATLAGAIMMSGLDGAMGRDFRRLRRPRRR